MKMLLRPQQGKLTCKSRARLLAWNTLTNAAGRPRGLNFRFTPSARPPCHSLQVATSFSSTAKVDGVFNDPNSAPRVISVSAAPGKTHTSFEWSDGHESNFHNSWLRDHCQCPDCLDSATMQRRFDSFDLVPPSTLSATLNSQINFENEGSLLYLEMTNGDTGLSHTAHFQTAWLRENCYSAKARSSRALAATSQPTTSSWDNQQLSDMCKINGDACTKDLSESGLHIPSTEFKDLDMNPLRLRSQLRRYGIAFITDSEGNSLDHAYGNVEMQRQLVDTVVRKYIGFPRETLWGTLWDTAVVQDDSEDQPRDTAYTNVALRNHVDCTYLRDPPELQVFLCGEESDDLEGGASTFQDGFRIADEIFRQSPEAFWFFAKTKLGFQCEHDGVNTLSYGTVFELDPAFEAHFLLDAENANAQTVRPPLQRYRYNNDDRAVLSHLPAKSVDDFYRHLPLLLDTLQRDDFILQKRLRKGQWAIVNNHRVLHGRTAFSGSKRCLVGCYAEMGEASFDL